MQEPGSRAPSPSSVKEIAQQFENAGPPTEETQEGVSTPSSSEPTLEQKVEEEKDSDVQSLDGMEVEPVSLNDDKLLKGNDLKVRSVSEENLDTVQYSDLPTEEDLPVPKAPESAYWGNFLYGIGYVQNFADKSIDEFKKHKALILGSAAIISCAILMSDKTSFTEKAYDAIESFITSAVNCVANTVNSILGR